MKHGNHSNATKRLESAWDADKDNRDAALSDLRNASGDQWGSQERRDRDISLRPCLTVNRMVQFVNQVSGAIRQARNGTDIFPADGDDENKEIAEIYEGLIRQIE